MTLQEAEKKLCQSLNIDYDNAIAGFNDLYFNADFSDPFLDYIQTGILKAWDYKPWPFSRAAKTLTAPTPTLQYYDYPDDVVGGSISLAIVGGKEYKKLIYEDFLRTLQLKSTSRERIWTEYQNFIFINQNAYSAGDEIDFYGKKKAPEVANSGDLLPFSPSTDSEEYSGNAAIVQLAKAEVMESEKKKMPAQAQQERAEAYQTLDIIWKPFADFLQTQQSQFRPMFNVPDLFGTYGVRDRGNFENYF